MSYSLRLVFAGLTPINTADGMHWRTRHSAKVRWERDVWVAVMLEHKPPKPLARARVRIVRCSSGREPDFENLTQGGKFLLDSLVKCGVLLDDSPEVIGQPQYDYEHVARLDQCMIVEVEEL